MLRWVHDNEMGAEIEEYNNKADEFFECLTKLDGQGLDENGEEMKRLRLEAVNEILEGSGLKVVDVKASGYDDGLIWQVEGESRLDQS